MRKTRLKADLARDLRGATVGRGHFGAFSKHYAVAAVDIFCHACYYMIETIREMGDNAAALFIQNLRKGAGKHGPLETKLVLDILGIFQTEVKNAMAPVV